MGRYQKTYHGLVQDDRGRILGKVVTEDRELIRAEMDYVKRLLQGIYGETKQERKRMGLNIVKLEGAIKHLKVDGSRASVLIDTDTENCKYIPCTVFESRELADKLGRFAVDDLIIVLGFIRSWSRKVNDKWENRVEMRITEIRNEPPKRERKPQQRRISDNDLPEEFQA